MTKRATVRTLRGSKPHAHRSDVMLYIYEANGVAKRHVVLEDVPAYYAECAARGAIKTLAILGYDVGEKP